MDGDSTMKGQMDSVMKAGAWVLGWAEGSSSKGYLCALPSYTPTPNPVVLLGSCVVIFPFFSRGQLSTLRSSHIFLCVENQRHGGWWVFAAPLSCPPGYLGPLTWLGFEHPGKHRVLDMLA